MACVFTCFEPLKTVETIILWLINLINGLQNDTHKNWTVNVCFTTDALD